MSTPPNPPDVSASLRAVHTALTAARAPRPMPGWLPPLSGLLFAGGFVGLGLFAAHPRTWAYLAAAVTFLMAFIVVTFVSSRAGGITPWPSGTSKARGMRQLAALLALVAGGITAIPYGFTGFAVVAGVGLGAVAWAQMARARKGQA